MRRFKRIHIVPILTLLICLKSFGQTDIPTEKVDLRLNSDILFSGETLRYAINVYSDEGIKEPISGFVYVQLVGENGIVFKHKIQLNSFTGSDEFFLSTELPSGSYYLLAHTRWMRNFDRVTTKRLIILNPFEEYLGAIEQDDTMLVETAQAQSGRQRENLEVFTTRSLIEMAEEIPAGNYSISVKDVVNLWSDNELQKSPSTTNTATSGRIEYLPEIEVELIEGTIASAAGQRLGGKVVTLSFLTDSTNVAATMTDAKGQFQMFYQSPNQQVAETYWSVLDFEGTYVIELKENFMSIPEGLDYSLPSIKSSFAAEIERRSFNVQIENAFFAGDEVIPFIDTDVFTPFSADSFFKTYNFDDFTRFKILREHFVEYIKTASMPRNEAGVFRLQSPDLELDFGVNPILVLLDGIVINSRAIEEFSPYRIEGVDLLNTRYFLNGVPFDGVISFRTKEGRLGGYSGFEKTKVVKIETAHVPGVKSTSRQREADSRMPDMRSELLWIPNLNISNPSNVPIDFNTSDVTGEFELIIQGVKKDGTPWSKRKRFVINDKEK